MSWARAPLHGRRRRAAANANAAGYSCAEDARTSDRSLKPADVPRRKVTRRWSRRCLGGSDSGEATAPARRRGAEFDSRARRDREISIANLNLIFICMLMRARSIGGRV